MCRPGICGGGSMSIVFADETAAAIENGHAPGTMPPEFTGGLGSKGAEALREFARAGGTLVFLNRASDYGIANLGVKAKNVVAGVPAQEFYSPGSLLNVKLDLRDPLTRGLPEDVAVWSEASPAWEGRWEGGSRRYPESGCAGIGLAAGGEAHSG